MPLYQKTRLTKKEDKLEKTIEDILHPWFSKNDFKETKPFRFSRSWDKGEEIIFLNIEPSCISINVASVHNDMLEVYELFADSEMRTNVEYGLAAESILTPKGIKRSDKSKTVFRILKNSKQEDVANEILASINSHLIQWFNSVRSPTCLLDYIQPSALMLWARANEIAGNIELARDAYSAMFERIERIIELLGSVDSFSQEKIGTREFTYLCRKLNTRLEDGLKLESMISFSPKASALKSQTV